MSKSFKRSRYDGDDYVKTDKLKERRSQKKKKQTSRFIENEERVYEKED